MWKDLSMQQRADLMDIYLSHGISSLDEMRNHYDSRNQFAEGGNLFSGEDTPTQQMNSGLNLYRNTNKAGDVWYTYQETPDSEEILLTPTNKRFSDDPTNWDYKDASGREYSPRMVSPSSSSTLEAFEKMGPLEKYVAELNWRAKNDPASIALQGKYTMPAIAAPLLAPLGEAFAGTTIAGVPATTWANTAMAAGFAGHGLNHWINEGIDGWGDAAMTALELAPLGGLAKPMFNKAALAIENYRYPFGRPQIPENFLTIKPQVRTKVGDVEINNPQLAYRQGGNGIVEDFINSGKVRTKENQDIVDTGKGFTFDFGHEYSEPMFAQGQLNWGLPVGNNAQNTGLLTTSELLGVGNRQSRLVDNVVNGTTDIRMFPTRSRGVTGRVPLSEDQLNATNTTAYTWEPGYGYKRVFTKETPVADWPMGRTASQITAENTASMAPKVNWDADNWFKTISGRNSYSAEEAAELASHVPEYRAIEQRLFDEGKLAVDSNGNIVVVGSEMSPQEYIMRQSEAFQKMNPEHHYVGVSKKLRDTFENEARDPATRNRYDVWTDRKSPKNVEEYAISQQGGYTNASQIEKVENQMSIREENYELHKEQLKWKLKHGKISQETYDRDLAALEDNYNIKQKEDGEELKVLRQQEALNPLNGGKVFDVTYPRNAAEAPVVDAEGNHWHSIPYLTVQRDAPVLTSHYQPYDPVNTIVQTDQLVTASRRHGYGVTHIDNVKDTYDGTMLNETIIGRGTPVKSVLGNTGTFDVEGANKWKLYRSLLPPFLGLGAVGALYGKQE